MAKRLPTLSLPVPALLVLVYAIWIMVGTGLLMLPSAAHVPVSFIDALFTATSAVTVTGLIVLDTGSDFTYFGQAVIAVMIQFGGLGLITFAVFVLSSLGQRIDIVRRRYLAEELNMDSLGSLIPFVKRILIIFLICETLGLIILATQFVPEQGWRLGLWTATFHSISAFNNAGFSTFSDSLMGYVGNPVIVWTISLQFILSGLGFLVLSELARVRKWRKMSLHTQLMLVGTLP